MSTAVRPHVALGAAGSDVVLHIPNDDVSDPEVSIVIPALNEEVTIGDFVQWCKEGLSSAGVMGEVLIVDSSDDRTAEIALAHGARVLKTERRGLGRAYIDALPFIRGRYVIMGDADCTYDFRAARALHSALPRGLRVRHGFALEGLDRARCRCLAASVPRHACDDLDPQPALLEPLLGHPLWYARHHAGRARAHGSSVPVVGVRLGDGAQVGAHGAADG